MKNLKSMAGTNGHAAAVATNSTAQASAEAFFAGASLTASHLAAASSNAIAIPSPSPSPSSASSSRSSLSSFTSSPSTATVNPSLPTYTAPGKHSSANLNRTISTPEAPPTCPGAPNENAGHSGDLSSTDCNASKCKQSWVVDLYGTASDIRSTSLARDSSAGYFGAEDALARALHLLSDLSLVPEEKRHPHVQSAQAAVAEAVPLVCALRSEVDELRTQLAAYGKLLAERDQAMERLRTDLADLEESRSLYRQQIAELCTSSVPVTTPPPSAELQLMSEDSLQPLSETLLLALSRGTCSHRQRLRCLPSMSKLDNLDDLDEGVEGREVGGAGQAAATQAAAGLPPAVHRSQRTMSLSPPSARLSSERRGSGYDEQKEHQSRHLLPPRHQALGCLPSWGSAPSVPSSSLSSVCGSAVSVREVAVRVLPSQGPHVSSPSPSRIETPVRQFAPPNCFTADAIATTADAPTAATVTASTDPAVIDTGRAKEAPYCTTPKAAAPGGCGSRGSSGSPVSPATFRHISVERFGPASDELPFTSPYTPTYELGRLARPPSQATATSDGNPIGLRHTTSGWESYGLRAAAALAAAATGVRKLWPTREWSDNDSTSAALTTTTVTMPLPTAVSIGTAGVDAECGLRTASDKAAALRTRRHSYIWRQRGSRGGGNGGDASSASAASARGVLWEPSRGSQAGGPEAVSFVWLNANEVESVPAATAMVL